MGPETVKIGAGVSAKPEATVDLSIVCVNWNSVEYLLECIPSIYEHTLGISFEIIVVDNASPLGDVGLLKERFPDITLIRSKENLGFAGANNLGVRHARGECIVFLNPDTKLVSPALTTMLHALRSLPDAGVVGCKLLNGDLSIQTSCIMVYPTILNQLTQVEYLRLRWPKLWGIGPLFSDNPAPARVEAISGACMLMRREAFENVGMFSEDYFMYAEDLDLCYKVERSGLSNYYVGGATIVHYAGKSSAPEWQTIMKLRSEVRFCVKNYGPWYGSAFRFAMGFNAIARLSLIAMFSIVKRDAQQKATLKSAALKWKSTIKALISPAFSSQYPTKEPKSTPKLYESNV
jgi:N-acetylglucosaminyl-diphospho-decaprenol L-rhamnosyltransferase